MDKLTAYEQHEIKSGRSITLTDALNRLQAELPFVAGWTVYPPRIEVVDGRTVSLYAAVQFTFDNGRGVRIAFGDEMPAIVRLDSVEGVRETIEREYQRVQS